MDALSDVLRLIRLRGCVYFQTDLAAPWGMTMAASRHAQFHILTRGQCWLQGADERQPRALAAGDVVVFPTGAPHVLFDGPRARWRPGIEVLEAHRAGRPLFQAGAAAATLICGHFEFDRGLDHPLIRDLPEQIHVPGADRKGADWVELATAILVRESGSQAPGAASLVDRLAEVLFIQVLRRYIEDTQLSRGYLAAMKDRRISTAIRLIHDAAHTNLSLDGIAQGVGMSRSAFALRFRELVGVTPMGYLTGWRMLMARNFLITTRMPLAEIGDRVGYASEGAFNRAFKRAFKLNPGAYRRLADGGTSAAGVADAR